MFKTHFSRCKLLRIAIHVTACARTTNIAYHSRVKGVPENSAQDCEQAVTMATKHAKSKFVCRINPCLHELTALHTKN